MKRESMNVLSACIVVLPLLAGCQGAKQQEVPVLHSPSTFTNQIVGGRCDGCEIMFEGMPEQLFSTDTIAEMNEPGVRLEVKGTVYKRDGKTPAEGVIVYFYHTDVTGRYTASKEQTVGRQNGHLRGWIKTNGNGEYRIYTIKPAPYPGATAPAHIHCYVKEPHINEYYVDEIEFFDDPLLTDAIKLQREKRGGSGLVVAAKDKNGWLTCKRDIILGMNIPGYPE